MSGIWTFYYIFLLTLMSDVSDYFIVSPKGSKNCSHK